MNSNEISKQSTEDGNHNKLSKDKNISVMPIKAISNKLEEKKTIKINSKDDNEEKSQTYLTLKIRAFNKKDASKKEIRRTTISNLSKYSDLITIINGMINSSQFKIFYKDDEDDNIRISNDKELYEAISMAINSKSILKLDVIYQITEKKKKEFRFSPDPTRVSVIKTIPIQFKTKKIRESVPIQHNISPYFNNNNNNNNTFSCSSPSECEMENCENVGRLFKLIIQFTISTICLSVLFHFIPMIILAISGVIAKINCQNIGFIIGFVPVFLMITTFCCIRKHKKLNRIRNFNKKILNVPLYKKQSYKYEAQLSQLLNMGFSKKRIDLYKTLLESKNGNIHKVISLLTL